MATRPKMTREEWLNAVAERLAPHFTALGAPPPPFRVSIGFTSTGRRGKRIAECHAPINSKDRHHEIFIRPDQAAPMDVAAILAHELIHACVTLDAGHGPAFRRVARAIGLEGPMRATTPGKGFRELAEPILEELGPLPHAELNVRRTRSDLPKKQTTRMFKAHCPECGYSVRLTRHWIDNLGAPICPLDQIQMEVPDAT